MKSSIKVYLILLCLALFSVIPAGSARANTAANARIINSATLSYNDGSGTKITAPTSVTIIVNLVPSLPTVVAVSGGTTTYNGANTPFASNVFTITATANGQDTYNLSSTVTASTNSSSPSTPVPAVASVAIGATVTASGSTTTVIIVPSDGSAVTTTVNGITAGNWVVINNELRQVQTVLNNPTGTSTITLAVALTTAPAEGVVVGQQVTVNVTGYSGTIITGGTDVTVSVDLTAASNTDSNVKATSTGSDLDTFTSGSATLNKYVRNVSSGIAGSGSTASYGGNTYYTLTVKAKPTDTLEYLLVCINPSTTGSVSAAAITDLLPVDFVTLKAGAYGGAGKDVTYVNDLGTASQLSAAVGDDAAQYNAAFDTTLNAKKGQLIVNIGATPGIPPAAGGTIGHGQTLMVLYQVTVN